MSIELYDINKTFVVKGKKIKALEDISIIINEGEFVGLLGPNGAGKTTLTRILATLLIPDSGEGYIAGIPLSKEKRIREVIGTVFGESGGRSLYYRLSIYDNLLFYSTLAGVPKKEAKKRINALLSYFDLAEKKDTLVMKLSTGMKAKVLLIRALVPLPKVLLLDEPTLGFDLIAFEKAKRLLKVLNEQYNTTILLTSHNFTEIEDLTQTLLLIDNGRIIDNCSQEVFKQVYSQKHLTITINLNYYDPFLLKREVEEKLDVKVVHWEKLGPHLLNLKIQPLGISLEKVISELLFLLIERNIEIIEVRPHVPTLREAFLAFLEKKNVPNSKHFSSQPQLIVE